jgi:hypothetical protein
VKVMIVMMVMEALAMEDESEGEIAACWSS